MERIDKDFLNELEGKIDEKLREQPQLEKEALESELDASSNDNEIAETELNQDNEMDLESENDMETVMFDLTEQEVIAEKKEHDLSEPYQTDNARVSFRKYHPMEMSADTIVTAENAEFAVRKFVKDLKECLQFSKSVRVRFEIKTMNDDHDPK
jgi:hypothetical protein